MLRDFKLAFTFIFPYWKKYWKYEVVLLAMLGLRFIAQLQIPTAFKFVVDTIVTTQFRRYFTVSLIAFCLLVLFAVMLSWGFKILVTWLGEALNIDITSSVFDHVLRQRRSFWERFYPNDVLTRLTQDLPSVKSFIVDNSHDLLFQTAILLGTVIIILIMSRSVGLVVLTLVPIIFAITFIGNQLLQKRGLRLGSLRSSFTQVFNEAIELPSQTFSWGIIPFFFRKYKNVALEMKREQISFQNEIQVINAVISILNLLAGTVAVIWLLHSDYEKGLLSTGAFMALIVYSGQATQSTVALAIAVTSGKLNRISILRVMELMSHKTSEVNQINPFAEHVVHPYFKGLLAGGVRVPKGGPFPYFLMGENGSGKTTYAHILTGFDDLSGRVVNQAWFLVPSTQKLFDGSLIENIRVISGREVSEDEVTRVLKENGLESLLSIFPQGFSTLIAENSEKISLGQKQATVLISAIVRDPEKIIVDEGLNSLELSIRNQIGIGLVTWLRRRRSIVIEHDGYLSAFASRPTGLQTVMKTRDL